MRSKSVVPRSLSPDPLYNSVLVAKFINRLMRDGKRSVAQKNLYRALDLVKSQTQKDPLVIFNQALENIKPQMEVRPRRIGGAAYQVPSPVRGARRDSLAVRWLIAASQSRSNSQYHTIAEKIAAEIIDATNNTGLAIKKKLDTHRMAEANKAFAHFRW